MHTTVAGVSLAGLYRKRSVWLNRCAAKRFPHRTVTRDYRNDSAVFACNIGRTITGEAETVGRLGYEVGLRRRANLLRCVLLRLGDLGPVLQLLRNLLFGR